MRSNSKYEPSMRCSRITWINLRIPSVITNSFHIKRISVDLKTPRELPFIVKKKHFKNYFGTVVFSTNEQCREIQKNVNLEHFQMLICLMQYSCTWMIIKNYYFHTQRCYVSGKKQQAKKPQRLSDKVIDNKRWGGNGYAK